MEQKRWSEEEESGKSLIGRTFGNSPGLFSIFLPRLPHSRTFDINIRICFWQSDLLLFGQGLRLLAIGRFAWGSLTSLRWRIRELARAAIFPALTLQPPHQRLAARWRPGVGGYRGPPPCPLTQGDGAPLREQCRSVEWASEEGPYHGEKGTTRGDGGNRGGYHKGPPKTEKGCFLRLDWWRFVF